MIRVLLILLGLLMLGLGVRLLAQLAQPHLPHVGVDGEQLLLWGGLLGSAVSVGFLMLYLLLHL